MFELPLASAFQAGMAAWTMDATGADRDIDAVPVAPGRSAGSYASGTIFELRIT